MVKKICVHNEEFSFFQPPKVGMTEKVRVIAGSGGDTDDSEHYFQLGTAFTSSLS